MRILVPSIVDPAIRKGGAWTSTRGFLILLQQIFPDAQIDVPCLPDWTPLRRRVRQFRSILSSCTGPLPAKVAFAVSDSMLDAVRRSPADLVVLNGSDLLWLLPHLPAGAPVAVLAHNLEFRILEQQSRALGPLAWPELRKSRRFELDGLRQVGYGLFLSEQERREAQQLLPGLATVTVAPTFDYQPLQTRPPLGDTLRLSLLSNFDWWPNREAIRWFLRHVWPRINPGAGPHKVELHLYGTGIEGERFPPNVLVHGQIADVQDAYRDCHLALTPSRYGAGIKIKLAEALYNGVPSLATTSAAHSISVRDGIQILDDPRDWAEFLRGNAVRDFVARPVPEPTREQFLVSRVLPVVEQFLHRVLRGA